MRALDADGALGCFRPQRGFLLRPSLCVGRRFDRPLGAGYPKQSRIVFVAARHPSSTRSIRSAPPCFNSKAHWEGGRRTPRGGQQQRHCSGPPWIDHSIDERDRLRMVLASCLYASRPALECLASKKREHRQTPRGSPRCQFGGMSLKGVQRNRTERVRWKRKPANVRSRPQS